MQLRDKMNPDATPQKAVAHIYLRGVKLKNR